MNINLLSVVASATALAVVHQLGPQSLPLALLHWVPDVLRDVLSFVYNATIALGTPFMAWHVAVDRSRAGLVGAVAAGSALTAAAAYEGSAGGGAFLLWGSVAAWWIAGYLLLSDHQWRTEGGQQMMCRLGGTSRAAYVIGTGYSGADVFAIRPRNYVGAVEMQRIIDGDIVDWGTWQRTAIPASEVDVLVAVNINVNCSGIRDVHFGRIDLIKYS
ncbi:hypothetical protein BJ170DRAFT_677784 [Xylariales sp. AK1849]|nr:hypothetical protein BJ170DRAFT_677784 [Xylariales sp. AK1849]